MEKLLVKNIVTNEHKIIDVKSVDVKIIKQDITGALTVKTPGIHKI